MGFNLGWIMYEQQLLAVAGSLGPILQPWPILRINRTPQIVSGIPLTENYRGEPIREFGWRKPLPVPAHL